MVMKALRIAASVVAWGYFAYFLVHVAARAQEVGVLGLLFVALLLLSVASCLQDLKHGGWRLYDYIQSRKQQAEDEKLVSKLEQEWHDEDRVRLAVPEAAGDEEVYFPPSPSAPTAKVNGVEQEDITEDWFRRDAA